MSPIRTSYHGASVIVRRFFRDDRSRALVLHLTDVSLQNLSLVKRISIPSLAHTVDLLLMTTHAPLHSPQQMPLRHATYLTAQATCSHLYKGLLELARKNQCAMCIFFFPRWQQKDQTDHVKPPSSHRLLRPTSIASLPLLDTTC